MKVEVVILGSPSLISLMVSVDVKATFNCHHKNNSCIKMGSGESHLNGSLTVSYRVTIQCPQITIFEEKGEPKRNRTKVLLTSLTPCRWAKAADVANGGL